MKRSAAGLIAIRLVAAVLLVASASAIWAQRGGGRAGSGGGRAISHGAAPGMSSHFSYSSPRSISTPMRYLPAGPRVYPAGERVVPSYTAQRPGWGPIWHPVGGQPVRREPERRRVTFVAFPYAVGVPYGIAGWLGPDYLAPDYLGSDYPSSDYGAYSDQPVDPGPAYYGSPIEPYYPGDTYGAAPLQPPTGDSASQAVAPPENDEPVTLIFKDGRPPEQIHNYILTPTTLYVQDERRRIIPVDQIDLALTEKANRSAGVEFHIPGPGK